MTEPQLNPAYRRTLRDTDEAHVTYDAEPNADGSEITVRRVVWKKAYRTKDRAILWLETEAALTRDEAQELIRDLVAALAVR